VPLAERGLRREVPVDSHARGQCLELGLFAEAEGGQQMRHSPGKDEDEDEEAEKNARA